MGGRPTANTAHFICERGTAQLDLFHGFADQCLRDYDLDGWTSPTWTFDGHEPT